MDASETLPLARDGKEEVDRRPVGWNATSKGKSTGRRRRETTPPLEEHFRRRTSPTHVIDSGVAGCPGIDRGKRPPSSSWTHPSDPYRGARKAPKPCRWTRIPRGTHGYGSTVSTPPGPAEAVPKEARTCDVDRKRLRDALCNASYAPTRVDTSPLSTHVEEGHLTTSVRHPFTALDVFGPPQGATSAATRSTRILSCTSVRAPRTCLLFRLRVHPQPRTDACVVFHALVKHTCGCRSQSRSVSNLPFERKRLKGRKETVKGKGAGSNEVEKENDDDGGAMRVALGRRRREWRRQRCVEGMERVPHDLRMEWKRWSGRTDASVDRIDSAGGGTRTRRNERGEEIRRCGSQSRRGKDPGHGRGRRR